MSGRISVKEPEPGLDRYRVRKSSFDTPTDFANLLSFVSRLERSVLLFNPAIAVQSYAISAIRLLAKAFRDVLNCCVRNRLRGALPYSWSGN